MKYGFVALFVALTWVSCDGLADCDSKCRKREDFAAIRIKTNIAFCYHYDKAICGGCTPLWGLGPGFCEPRDTDTNVDFVCQVDSMAAEITMWTPKIINDCELKCNQPSNAGPGKEDFREAKTVSKHKPRPVPVTDCKEKLE